MTDPKPGDRIRAIQHYVDTDVIIEIEGTVSYLHNDLAVLEGGVQAWWRDRRLSSNYVQVTLEIIKPALLPPGTVVRARCHAYCPFEAWVRKEEGWHNIQRGQTFPPDFDLPDITVLWP